MKARQRLRPCGEGGTREAGPSTSGVGVRRVNRVSVDCTMVELGCFPNVAHERFLRFDDTCGNNCNLIQNSYYWDTIFSKYIYIIEA